MRIAGAESSDTTRWLVHGVVGGIIAGIVFAVFEMIMAAIQMGGEAFFMPLRMTGLRGRANQTAVCSRGWVSYMRARTITPETAVSALTVQMAGTMPSRSAIAPATSAPTAKPMSRQKR